MLSTGAEINTMFKGYTNFPCLLQSVAIFVLFKYMDYKKNIWSILSHCV